MRVTREFPIFSAFGRLVVAKPLFGALLLLPVMSTNVAAAGAFDGAWQVSLEFTGAARGNPVCTSFDPRHEVRVRDGKVSGSIRHRHAGLFDLDGHVATDGTFKARAKGEDTVTFSGRLEHGSGSGKWQAKRSRCDGKWTAEKE